MPAPTLPRLQPFDTAPHHTTTELKGKCWCTSIVVPPGASSCTLYTSCAYRLVSEREARTGGEREKGCTHIRRRRASRIVSRTYEQAREKAGEGQKGSWTPLSVGIPYEEKDRQTNPTLLPSPLAFPPDHAFSTYRHNCHNIAPPYLSLLLLPTPAPVLPIHHPAWFHPQRPRHFRVESIENLIEWF